MPKKYYAVKQGRKTGLFENWNECSEQVNGYSGAVYKSFKTKHEAETYLGVNNIDESVILSEDKIEYETISDHSVAVAYVDGSYDNYNKMYSYGMVIFHDEIEERFAEKFDDPSLVSMRNVAGEIKGAEMAMQFCLDNDISQLDLYYDYEGIEKWCTGEWKARKEGTKAYKKYYDNANRDLKINFVKVVGHSGDKYNDLADELAKSALGITKIPEITHCQNNLIANNIEFHELVDIIDMLKTDIEDLEVTDCSNPYGDGFNLRVKHPHSQKLKILHYSSKNKALVQGKQEDLFNHVSMYLIELLDIEEVPEFLNKIYNLDINLNEIEEEFKRYFPNGQGQFTDKVNNYLHQAVYNLKIEGDVYNATFLVEPAIRPLEAILKIALINNDIPIREQDKNYDSFFVFKNKNGSYQLKKQYEKPQHSKELLNYLSECYNHYKNHRHTLCHWDNPLELLDTTRVIKTTTEAHTLIKDTIKIIDKYYSI